MTQKPVVPIQHYKDKTILSHTEPQSTPKQTTKRMVLFESQDIDFTDVVPIQLYKDKTILSNNEPQSTPKQTAEGMVLYESQDIALLMAQEPVAPIQPYKV